MRSHRIHLALAVLVLAATAPAWAANECLSIAVTGAPAAYVFADSFESGDTLVWSAPALPIFGLVSTGDLAVEVTFDAAVTGDHLLELRWSLPGGQLYQSVAVPFTVGALDLATPARVVPGYPFPIAVVAALSPTESPGGTSLVSSSLPVAGTLIVETGLRGAWSVAAYLDGSETACGSAYDFRLEP